jgi:hypothetical protein
MFINKLKNIYNLHNLKNIEWFLGVCIIKDEAAKKIWLVYNIYIKKILKKFALNS